MSNPLDACFFLVREERMIESQFELNGYPVAPVTSWWRSRLLRWMSQLVTSFRFVRVCCFVAICFVFGIVFYAVENTYNPLYAIGQNASGTSNTTAAPATGIPSSLNFIDALFVSVSMWSNTGLSTVDFSLWCFTSQVVGIFCMLLGCLPFQAHTRFGFACSLHAAMEGGAVQSTRHWLLYLFALSFTFCSSVFC